MGPPIRGNNNNSEGFDTLIENLIRGYAESLGSTKIKVSVDPPTQSRGAIIAINPTKPTAAPLSVHAEDPTHLDLTLGKATRFEIEVPQGKTGQLLNLLEGYVEALVKGHFRETVWMRGGRIVKAEGRVRLGETTKTIVYRDGLIAPFLPKKRTEIAYTAY